MWCVSAVAELLGQDFKAGLGLQEGSRLSLPARGRSLRRARRRLRSGNAGLQAAAPGWAAAAKGVRTSSTATAAAERGTTISKRRQAYCVLMESYGWQCGRKAAAAQVVLSRRQRYLTRHGRAWQRAPRQSQFSMRQRSGRPPQLRWIQTQTTTSQHRAATAWSPLPPQAQHLGRPSHEHLAATRELLDCSSGLSESDSASGSDRSIQSPPLEWARSLLPLPPAELLGDARAPLLELELAAPPPLLLPLPLLGLELAPPAQ